MPINKNTRFRNFVFTSYRILTEDERRTLFEDVDIRYIVYQVECCPTTNRRHMQGYCELHTQLRLSSIRQMFQIQDDGGDSFHIERRIGTPKQAADYCKKQETRIEGPYEHGTISASGTRYDILAIKDYLEEGNDICEAFNERSFPVDTLVKNWNFFNNFQLVLNNKPRDFKSKVIYVWGPTGTGKSRLAADAGASFVSITKSGFMNGYAHQKVVCFDDFTYRKTMSREQWLTLMDRYPCTVDVKNMSNIQWNPETIYVTSNFSPELFTPEELRRIDTIIHLNGRQVGDSVADNYLPTSESTTPESDLFRFLYE